MKPQCPSVGTSAVMHHEPCNGSSCSWWDRGCTAQQSVVPLLKLSKKRLKPCELAPNCRWHMDAVMSGEVACIVRRSGDTCQHQGGEYNTFELEMQRMNE